LLSFFVSRPIFVDEGDERLRKKSRPIRRFDKKLKKFAEDMVETMRQAEGVGLAAPQVGVNERLIVVEIPEDLRQKAYKAVARMLEIPRN